MTELAIRGGLVAASPTALPIPPPLPDLAAPALVAQSGDAAAWRYVGFFTAHTRNPNTRRAYSRACARFLGRCDERGLGLAAVRPFDAAGYVEGLQAEVSAPSVKQQLAAIPMLCDWLAPAR